MCGEEKRSSLIKLGRPPDLVVPPANKVEVRLRPSSIHPCEPLPHLICKEEDGWSVYGGGSYAGTPLPNPWQGFASAILAPILSCSCCNNLKLGDSFSLGAPLLTTVTCARWSSCEPKALFLKKTALAMLKLEDSHTLMPALASGCKLGLALSCELAAMVPHQVQVSPAAVSNSLDVPSDSYRQITVGSRFRSGSMLCSFFLLVKDWILSGTTSRLAIYSRVTTNQCGIGRAAIGTTLFLLLHVWYTIPKLEKHTVMLDLLLWGICMERMTYMFTTEPSPNPIRCGVLLIVKGTLTLMLFPYHFRRRPHALYMISYSELSALQICLTGCYTSDHLQAAVDEVYAIFMPLGLIRRRRVRGSSWSFLRFSGEDISDLSSMMHPRDLQLNPSPHMRRPTRLLVEPLALRLGRLQEAMEEHNCRFFVSEFSLTPWQAPIVFFCLDDMAVQ